MEAHKISWMVLNINYLIIIQHSFHAFHIIIMIINYIKYIFRQPFFKMIYIRSQFQISGIWTEVEETGTFCHLSSSRLDSIVACCRTGNNSWNPSCMYELLFVAWNQTMLTWRGKTSLHSDFTSGLLQLQKLTALCARQSHIWITFQ